MNRSVRPPKCLRAGLTALALTAACVAATNAAARPSVIGPLKMCVYITMNDTTPTENVKVFATGAAGLKGYFVLKGNAANQKSHFTVRRNGTAFTSFAVTAAGGERVTVTLASKSRTINIPLPAGSNIKQQPGCTPQ